MALRTRLERRNIHSARDRVRHFLSLNVGADGHTVDLPGTLKELAADLGLTHEALYRTLARMQADGEIERTGSYYHDPPCYVIGIILRAYVTGYELQQGANNTRNNAHENP